MDQEQCRTLIENTFISKQKVNSKFSLRSYSKQLGIDPGSLSRFLKGDRQLSEKKLKSVIMKLGLSENSLRAIFESSKDIAFSPIEERHFSLLANWYYTAILECIELDEFEPSPQWIAQKLNISIPVINVAVNQLIRAGAIELTAEGSWTNTFSNISTQKNENVEALALRNHQKQLLEMAKQSIDHASPENKSHTAYITALDSKIIPEIKQEIKKARRKIANLIKKKSKNKDKIYCLQINFFEEHITEGNSND